MIPLAQYFKNSFSGGLLFPEKKQKRCSASRQKIGYPSFGKGVAPTEKSID
jgi:hypothetical protein